MRVFLEATSEANETMGGANNLSGQGSKKAMSSCRRDLHKESFEWYRNVLRWRCGRVEKGR